MAEIDSFQDDRTFGWATFTESYEALALTASSNFNRAFFGIIGQDENKSSVTLKADFGEGFNEIFEPEERPIRLATFQVGLSTLNVENFQPVVTSLGICIDIPDVFNRIESQPMAVGENTIVFRKPFHSLPQISAFVLGGDNGDTVEIISRTKINMVLKITNTGIDVLQTKTITWLASGF